MVRSKGTASSTSRFLLLAKNSLLTKNDSRGMPKYKFLSTAQPKVKSNGSNSPCWFNNQSTLLYLQRDLVEGIQVKIH